MNLLVRSKDVLSVPVKNRKKESLGEIEEIVLHKITGEVAYVVLSFGGLFGLGDKLFVVPWNSLHYDAEENAFILNVDKDRLENAPGFDKSNWPDMTNDKWILSIDKYYK